MWIVSAFNRDRPGNISVLVQDAVPAGMITVSPQTAEAYGLVESKKEGVEQRVRFLLVPDGSGEKIAAR